MYAGYYRPTQAVDAPVHASYMHLLTVQALLANSTLRHLKDDDSRIMKQLEERKALAELLAAVDSDDPAAKSRLSSLTQVSIQQLLMSYTQCTDISMQHIADTTKQLNASWM